MVSGFHAVPVFQYRSWMCKTSPFPDEQIDSRIKISWTVSLSIHTADIINHLIFLMSTFIKGHRRSDTYPVCCNRNAVQQRSYMSVIPDIICTSSINRNCCNWCDRPCSFALITDLHLHDLCCMCKWRKRSYFCRQSIFFRRAYDCLPHKSCCQGTFFLLLCKPVQFCFCGRTCYRPASDPFYLAPEISGRTVIM